MARYRKRDPARLADVLGTSFSKFSIPALLREYRIFSSWTRAVGENISKRTMPKRMIGSTLYVNVSSQVWMTELTYQKREIIERINTLAGEGSVKEIIFKPGTLKKTPLPVVKETAVPISVVKLSTDELNSIDEEVSEIPDRELRNILKRVIIKSKGGAI